MSMGTLARDSVPSASSRRFHFTFHFVMALIMVAVIVFGFKDTVDARLLHPSVAPPPILYAHAAIFCAWLSLYVVQTGLIAAGNTSLHRRLGLIWVTVGVAVPVIGALTAIIMRRFEYLTEHRGLSFLAVPLFDMVVFAVLFVLALRWRRRPEYHRRLMFLATCCLMDAGFARFPVTADFWFAGGGFMAAVDCLILAGIARDLLNQRRVHIVFATAVPLMIAVQVGAWALWRHPPPLWNTLCHLLIGAA